MIQAIITRMAQNSFVIKGWSVSLAAALLALSSADNNTDLAWIAAGAITVFCALDAYYLARERSYRDLYQHAISVDKTTWTLTAEPVNAPDVLRAARSPSVWLPHGSTLIAAVAVALLV